MALLSITAIDIYRFAIPFIRPIQAGQVVLHQREGFLIELSDQNGRKASGEVAPLPGLDITDPERCRKDLSLVKKMLAGGVVNTDHFDLHASGLGMISRPEPLSPHTLFGLESALLGLYLQYCSADLPELVRVPVNGLFIPDTEDNQTDIQIQALQQSGMKTVKVKIGRLPAEQEIQQILRLHTTLGPDLKLRLDGNRLLSASAYAHYFSALHHINVEYAEEPLREGEASSSKDVPWGVALDESLPKYLSPSQPDPAGLPPDIRTVILKPGLLPGLSGMASFIASARKRNIQTVLSSSFNTGVGIASLSLFARMAGLSSDVACGFDTLRYLRTDVLTNFPPVSKGALMLPRSFLTNMILNFHVLSREDL